jgi:uridine phosphorylase
MSMKTYSKGLDSDHTDGDIPVMYMDVAVLNATMVSTASLMATTTPPPTEARISVPNAARIDALRVDYLYHLGIAPGRDDLTPFADVRAVVTAGSAQRIEAFAQKLSTATGAAVVPYGKTERYTLLLVGNVVCVSHGIGMPSMSIVITEVAKLLYHARAHDVLWLRVGTCGGIGVERGTVVLTRDAVDGRAGDRHETVVLGRRTLCMMHLCARLRARAVELAQSEPPITIVEGDTYGADCFYEGQARTDGVFASYTADEARRWLLALRDDGVRNIEMEAPWFATFCAQTQSRGAIIDAVLVDRLRDDQVDATPAELAAFSDNAQQLALRVVVDHCAGAPASAIDKI